MNFKTLKYGALLLFFIFLCVACGDDDDDIAIVPPRDRAEQQLADNDSIIDYLSSHYYNSGFLASGTNLEYSDIEITKLEEGEDVPADHTLLIEAAEMREVEYLDVQYQYYILKINQGGGESPRFTDQIRFRFEGIILETDTEEPEVFDSNIQPDILFLQADGINPAAIQAWQYVFPEFNAASSFDSNNGIVNYENFGLGVMFVPSGLCYFANPPFGSSIGLYENLVFKFELLQTEVGDADQDGIPSYIEDLNNNLDITDDDTDEDGSLNFIDTDDDNDFVLTRDELIPSEYTFTADPDDEDDEPVLAENEFEVSREEVAGIVTLKTLTIADSDNDGNPDYLDDTITLNYNQE